MDTPIQLDLASYYHNVKYMLHSHVYTTAGSLDKEDSMTERCLPCGAIEEANEICKVMPRRDSSNFFVNLRGHGSIILAEDLDYFKRITFEARPTPEKIPFD